MDDEFQTARGAQEQVFLAWGGNSGLVESKSTLLTVNSH